MIRLQKLDSFVLHFCTNGAFRLAAIYQPIRNRVSQRARLQLLRAA